MNLRSLGANVTELDTGAAIVLFSYNTPVAAKVKGKLYRTSESYSKTTTSHINKWLERRPGLSRSHSLMRSCGARYQRKRHRQSHRNLRT